MASNAKGGFLGYTWAANPFAGGSTMFRIVSQGIHGALGDVRFTILGSVCKNHQRMVSAVFRAV